MDSSRQTIILQSTSNPQPCTNYSECSQTRITGPKQCDAPWAIIPSARPRQAFDAIIHVVQNFRIKLSRIEGWTSRPGVIYLSSSPGADVTKSYRIRAIECLHGATFFVEYRAFFCPVGDCGVGTEEEEERMGRIFTVELDGRIYRCRFCRTHLALVQDVVSRSFQCRRGKAYLFNSVANVSVGDKEDRMMLSGLHTVADLFCCFCGQNVGWKYELAHDRSQKYKEGKFVLERGKLVDGIDAEFYIDTRPSGSDADEN